MLYKELGHRPMLGSMGFGRLEPIATQAPVGNCTRLFEGSKGGLICREGISNSLGSQDSILIEDGREKARMCVCAGMQACKCLRHY